MGDSTGNHFVELPNTAGPAGSVADQQLSDTSDQNPRAGSASSDRTTTPYQKKIVDVACWPCRRRKGKCSGERPACASCLRRAVECAYEYDEGLTRVGSLKMKLHKSTTKTENLEYLFDQLRTRSDQESALLLAFLRLGCDVDKIVAQLKSAPQQLLSRDAAPNLSLLMAESPENFTLGQQAAAAAAVAAAASSSSSSSLSASGSAAAAASLLAFPNLQGSNTSAGDNT